MKQVAFGLCAAFLYAGWLLVGHASDKHRNVGGSPVDVSNLLSKVADDRLRALKSLDEQQASVRQEVQQLLDKASRACRDDDALLSPLHVTILAASHLRVYESEDTLLSLIGYRVDAATFPVGGQFDFKALAPAADALVKLRVSPSKVVDAMRVGEKTDREIRLLTWVLASRLGDVAEVQRVLRSQEQVPNISRAIECLSTVEFNSFNVLLIEDVAKE